MCFYSFMFTTWKALLWKCKFLCICIINQVSITKLNQVRFYLHLFWGIFVCLFILLRWYLQDCPSSVVSKTWNMCTILFVHKTQTWKQQVILPSKVSCECMSVPLCVCTDTFRIWDDFWVYSHLCEAVISRTSLCLPSPGGERKQCDGLAQGLSQRFHRMLLFANQPLHLTHCSIRGHCKEQGLT